MTNPTERPYKTALIIISIMLVALAALFLYREMLHKQKVNMLLEERNYFLLENSSTTKAWEDERAAASSTITELSSRLHLTSEELEDIERDLRREKKRNDDFADQIEEISGTVGVLDKLSKTDEELLENAKRLYGV